MKIKLLKMGSAIMQAIWTLTMMSTFAAVFGIVFSRANFEYGIYKCAPHHHAHGKDQKVKAIGHIHRHEPKLVTELPKKKTKGLK